MMHDDKNLSSHDWIVFKGGAAFNQLIPAFQRCFPKTVYALPVTDDGGSSREIGRVFGGPSIGDIRSTLTRLSDESTAESQAVKRILEHRLHGDDDAQAAAEWHSLLEDRHVFYAPLSSKYKELIRGFLCKFEEERLRRIISRFDLKNGSIGNFFFSGARMVLGSLETAIFMYSGVAQIPKCTDVVPIIDSRDRLGIAALLDNGQKLIGQNLISHGCKNGRVNKLQSAALPSPINKLYYVDQFNNQIDPEPLPGLIKHIQHTKGIIYGTGSLWTSIIPSLILRGMGEAISLLNIPKIALLNCCHDRETYGLSALGYVHHLSRGLNRYGELDHPPSAYLTHLYYTDGSEFAVDEKEIQKLGIEVHCIPADQQCKFVHQQTAHPLYSTDSLMRSFQKIAST